MSQLKQGTEKYLSQTIFLFLCTLKKTQRRSLVKAKRPLPRQSITMVLPWNARIAWSCSFELLGSGKNLVTSTRTSRSLNNISVHREFSEYLFQGFSGFSLENSSVYVSVVHKKESTWPQDSGSCPYCISPDALLYIFTLRTAMLWAHSTTCWSWQRLPWTSCSMTCHQGSLCNVSLSQVQGYHQVLYGWFDPLPTPFQAPQLPYGESRTLQIKPGKEKSKCSPIS